MVKKIKKIYPQNLGLYESEISVDISLTSFFTAVSLFFMGILLKESSFREYIKLIELPILFLMISACGFLYSTLIYANATENLLFLNQKFLQEKFGQKEDLKGVF